MYVVLCLIDIFNIFCWVDRVYRSTLWSQVFYLMLWTLSRKVRFVSDIVTYQYVAITPLIVGFFHVFSLQFYRVAAEPST